MRSRFLLLTCPDFERPFVPKSCCVFCLCPLLMSSPSSPTGSIAFIYTLPWEGPWMPRHGQIRRFLRHDSEKEWHCVAVLFHFCLDDSEGVFVFCLVTLFFLVLFLLSREMEDLAYPFNEHRHVQYFLYFLLILSVDKVHVRWRKKIDAGWKCRTSWYIYLYLHFPS
jgi:hypothetical protein